MVKTYALRADHNPQASRYGGNLVRHKEQRHRQQQGFECGANWRRLPSLHEEPRCLDPPKIPSHPPIEHSEGPVKLEKLLWNILSPRSMNLADFVHQKLSFPRWSQSHSCGPKYHSGIYLGQMSFAHRASHWVSPCLGHTQCMNGNIWQSSHRELSHLKKRIYGV